MDRKGGLRKTSEGVRYYVDDPQLSGQRIVLRAWPSSWSEGKWILEAFAEYDCQVELAVLPSSSPCGSAEADDLTKLLLSERGARVFSQGKRVLNAVMELRALREALECECHADAHKQLSITLKGLKETHARAEAERLAEWKRRIAELNK